MADLSERKNGVWGRERGDKANKSIHSTGKQNRLKHNAAVLTQVVT